MTAPAWLPTSIILALAAASIRPACATDLHLRYAEAVSPLTIERAANDRQHPGVTPRALRMHFHALQHDFDATLEDNSRVLDGLSAARRARLGSLELYRGTLAGIPGGWVRVTVHNGLARASLGRC